MGLHNKCLTEEDRKERRKINNKTYYEKNKNNAEYIAKRKTYSKLCNDNYYKRNREKIIQKNALYNYGVYYEKYKENQKKYYKQKTETAKRKEVERVKLYREKVRLGKLQEKLDTKQKKIYIKIENANPV